MPDTWNEWGKHVLSEIKRLNDNQRCMITKIDEIKKQSYESREEISKLKIKASLLGLIAGTLPAIVLIITKVYIN